MERRLKLVQQQLRHQVFRQPRPPICFDLKDQQEFSLLHHLLALRWHQRLKPRLFLALLRRALEDAQECRPSERS
jgi:hypothetical protein